MSDQDLNLPQYYQVQPHNMEEPVKPVPAFTPVEETKNVPQELGMVLTGLLLITLAMVFVRTNITVEYLPAMAVMFLMIVSGLVLSGRALYLQSNLNRTAKEVMKYAERTYDESVKEKAIIVTDKDRRSVKLAVITAFIIGVLQIGFILYAVVTLAFKILEGIGS